MRPILLSLLFVLAGCAGSGEPDQPPQTAGQVDLQRYQGTWYELARLPMFFQRNCVASEAHYRLQESGSVAVTNRCRTATGEWQEALGEARLQQEGRTDKLWVHFDNWFSNLFPGLTRGEYWVLYLDADYQTALVGHPNREYLWLLSRSPEVASAVSERLLAEARSRGYDTAELVWRED
ncbi:lipocalin family protein [Pseudomonas sp. Gutcm_11s]|uniref:lipocalin family protein n=1 Tax=Pseudomonas sp. Gutcm_11s TaxID=3026088 RepID=UPI00235E400C|nr:lipocalin family protein [Pseudomonas sp. Gutcm_11s]MDD0845290.1 lipocalin family protein [Pseudomonas sp. Gutcm_11s]